MGFWNDSNRQPKPKTRISSSVYKSPLDAEPGLVSAAVLNLDKWEADAVMRFAKSLQDARGKGGTIRIQTDVQYPGRPDEWGPQRLAEVRNEFRDGAPEGWQKEVNVGMDRIEYRDLATDKRYYDDGGILTELIPMAVTTFYCTNGHALDYRSQICNICTARVADRATSGPGPNVFGDEELIAKREEMQGQFDEQRRERERIKRVDPSGRFSGLELD